MTKKEILHRQLEMLLDRYCEAVNAAPMAAYVYKLRALLAEIDAAGVPAQ